MMGVCQASLVCFVLMMSASLTSAIGLFGLGDRGWTMGGGFPYLLSLVSPHLPGGSVRGGGRYLTPPAADLLGAPPTLERGGARPAHPVYHLGNLTEKRCNPPCASGCCLLKPGKSVPICQPYELFNSPCHWFHCLEKNLAADVAIYGNRCPCVMGMCCVRKGSIVSGKAETFDGMCSTIS